MLWRRKKPLVKILTGKATTQYCLSCCCHKIRDLDLNLVFYCSYYESIHDIAVSIYLRDILPHFQSVTIANLKSTKIHFQKALNSSFKTFLEQIY